MFNLSISIGIIIILLAFFAEYIDSSLGMGYGTSLTPILLFMGFEPLQIVPAILLSETFTGLLASITHALFGNVSFKLRDTNTKLSLHLKIALLLALCGIIGTVAAVYIAINISSFYLKLYISILTLIIGLYILLNRHKQHIFSFRRILILGLLASFNKGISGGGYGPVITGGQILAGVNGKSAIAITSLAEGLTCLVGFLFYLNSNVYIDFSIAPYLLIGAILSVPLSGLTIKKINDQHLKKFIGYSIVLLGCWCLFNLL